MHCGRCLYGVFMMRSVTVYAAREQRNLIEKAHHMVGGDCGQDCGNLCDRIKTSLGVFSKIRSGKVVLMRAAESGESKNVVIVSEYEVWDAR